MSDASNNEATQRFAWLWGDDSHTWNHIQYTLDALGSQHSGVEREASESTQGLSEGITPSIENQRSPAKPAKLNVRLDLAGSDDAKTSRRLRWQPADTRDIFFRKVAELFPGKSIQQVSVHLCHETPVNVQATGPEGEWKIVQEEWLKRLQDTSKQLKEPSAEVYLAGPTE